MDAGDEHCGYAADVQACALEVFPVVGQQGLVLQLADVSDLLHGFRVGCELPEQGIPERPVAVEVAAQILERADVVSLRAFLVHLPVRDGLAEPEIVVADVFVYQVVYRAVSLEEYGGFDTGLGNQLVYSNPGERHLACECGQGIADGFVDLFVGPSYSGLGLFLVHGGICFIVAKIIKSAVKHSIGRVIVRCPEMFYYEFCIKFCS